MFGIAVSAKDFSDLMSGDEEKSNNVIRKRIRSVSRLTKTGRTSLSFAIVSCRHRLKTAKEESSNLSAGLEVLGVKLGQTWLP